MPHSIPHPIIQLPGEFPDDYDEPSKRHLLWHIWRVLRRRIWPIVFFVVLLLPPLWLHLLAQPYLYKATAWMLIEDKEPKISFIEGILGLDPQIGENLSTQLHLLQGTVLIARVIENEHLLDSKLIDELTPPPQKNKWLFQLLEIFGIPVPPRSMATHAVGSREASLSALVNHIRANLRITPVKNSHMVEIEFISKDPERSAQVVNAIARNHIEWQMETRTAMIKRISKLLVQRLDDLTDNLEKAEKALEAFRQKTGLITSEEKSSIEWQQLQAVNDEYSMTIAKTLELQIRIQKLEDWIDFHTNRKSNASEPGSEVTFSSLLSDLVRDSLQKETLIARISGRFSENEAPLSRLRKDLAKTNAAIQTEANRLLTLDRHELEAAQGRLAKIEKRLAQEQKKFKEFQTKAMELKTLEREVDTNRELHSIFLKRFKDTNILGDMNIPVIQLIDPAEPPNQIHSPKFGEWTLLTILCGFLVGAITVILMEVVDPTLKTPYETEKAIDLPLLGWVPLIAHHHSTRNPEQLRSCAPGTPIGEALQGIRTSLMMIHPHEPVKSIMIASCGAGEGRTELVHGLAKVCVLDGERVLILDADFRNHRHPPSDNPETRKHNKPGISGIIHQAETLSETLLTPSASDQEIKSFHTQLRKIILDRIEPTREGYHVLGPGQADVNPTKILSSHHWPAILRILREEFDRILVDSPPVLRFTDAQLLGVHIEAVILLIKSAVTHKEHLMTARKRMIRSRTPLAGVILTQLDMRKHRAELREYGHS
ncbi:MAG: polysaccharide biosynthesis tyrosine autokinase [Magnetococcales bacterium]|nr:polysaccharide biosynthesis tyrosine autokinase [Magnetococcales bacterium]